MSKTSLCLHVSLLALAGAACLHAAATTTVVAGGVRANRRLIHALKAIAPGSAATDEQTQALVHDLSEVEHGGFFVASNTDLQQLAVDLEAAASEGQFDHKALALLAAQLDTALNSVHLEPARLESTLADLATALRAGGVELPLGQLIVADLTAIHASFYDASESLGETFTLHEEGIPPFLLMNYSGTASRISLSTEGHPTDTGLTVEATGLPLDNPYTVAVTKISDGTKVILGTFTVSSGVAAASLSSAVAVGSPNAEILSFGSAEFGATGQPFPDGFDVADVATLTVTDSDGVERFTTTFVNDADLQSSNREVHLRVTAGAADPAAYGTIVFHSNTLKTRVTAGEFQLWIAGLPKNAPVTLVADGAAAGQFNTTAQGRLRIGSALYPIAAATGPVPSTPARKLLPPSVDLSTLRSVTLTDAAGNVLASGSL